MWPPNPKESHNAEEVGCSLVDTKKVWSHLFPISLAIMILQSLEQRAGWENFALSCNLSSIEVTAKELDVRTATVSTNMMLFTGTLRQREDVMVITMSRNQFAA